VVSFIYILFYFTHFVPYSNVAKNETITFLLLSFTLMSMTLYKLCSSLLYLHGLNSV